MDSIVSFDVGFTKQMIDINTFKITDISETGYSMNVSFECTPNTSGTYATIAKVNDKFKVLIVGSGDTTDGYTRMEQTLESICK